MRRLAALFLLGIMLIFGTGVLEYVHALKHRLEDSAEAARAIAVGRPAVPHHEHDDNNCPMHAQLHMLMIVISWSLLMVCVGRSIPFAPWEPLAPLAAAVTGRPSCRDPPFALN